MPVVNVFLGINNNGVALAPTENQVLAVQKAINDNLLNVLSANFPSQLGFQDAAQIQIASQEVRSAFPGYIWTDVHPQEYPTFVHQKSTTNSVNAQVQVQIVELALNESIQDKLVSAAVSAIKDTMGPATGLPVNIAAGNYTGNIDITLPNSKQGGVISADGRDNTIGFHKVLWEKILAKTDSLNLNLNLADTLNNIDGLRGGKGNDSLLGLAGDDLLVAGAGNDVVYGGIGNDRLFGDDGDDTLYGVGQKNLGTGTVDELTGGAGKDRFMLGNRKSAFYAKGGNLDYALIRDFTIGQDRIQLEGRRSDYVLEKTEVSGIGTEDEVRGTGIFTKQGELIGVVENAPNSLSLSKSSQFVFV
jgi:RTX calcium-binding nonapeptide repeat (4 copies)